MTYREADYPCVGICMNDPDTGYCIGCGRSEAEIFGDGEPVPVPQPLPPAEPEAPLPANVQAELGPGSD